MPRRLILVGAFALVAIGALFAVPAWRASRGDRAAREVTAVLTDAHGLRVGDPVYYQGVGVGAVRAVEPLDGRVHVRLALGRPDVPLRSADVVRVRADAASGGAVVDIVPSAGAGAPLPRRPGVPDTLAAGPYVPPDTLVVRLAREAAESLRRVIAPRAP